MNFLKLKNSKFDSFKIFIIFLLIINIYNFINDIFFHNYSDNKCLKNAENNEKIIKRIKNNNNNKFTIIDRINYFDSDKYIKSECDNCSNLNCQDDLNSQINRLKNHMRLIFLNIILFYKKEAFLFYFISDNYLFSNFIIFMANFPENKFTFNNSVATFKSILCMYFFVKILKKN